MPASDMNGYCTGDAPSPLVVLAASLLPTGRALDLACGRGRHTLYLRSLDWSVVAIDRAPGVDDALTLDLERDPLPFSEESFDLIVMTLYHQPSLWPEIRRLLRPGGLLATSAKLMGRFAARPGELREAFGDWEVVRYEERDGVAELVVIRTC
jgi:SAM-dependent methyltransferase